MARKMKDSGIEWIGEIPEDWEISKIKYVSDLNGRIGFRGYKQSDLVEEEHGAITLGPPNMDDGKLNLLNCKYLSWEKYYESPEIQLRVGDILLVKTASVGKVAYVDRLVKEMTINPQILIIKSKNINNKFLFYAIFSEFFQSQVEMSVTGGTVPTLSQEKISNFEITNPPMISQIKIAKYLDKMCFEVESISNKINLEIENLENYKKSVITEAVTKGLDKNVEMKDSGIEWIGEIPKHWKLAKLKYIGETKNENKTYRKGDIFIGLENIGSFNGKIISINTDYEECDTPFFNKGDFLFSKLRPYLAKGFLAEYKGFSSGELIRIIFNHNQHNNYYKYQLLSVRFINLINSMTYGVKMPRTSWQDLKEQIAVEPPYIEQCEIANYLNKKTKLIDDSISIKQKQLETLEEYKKSLIYEYVTGKKEV